MAIDFKGHICWPKPNKTQNLGYMPLCHSNLAVLLAAFCYFEVVKVINFSIQHEIICKHFTYPSQQEIREIILLIASAIMGRKRKNRRQQSLYEIKDAKKQEKLYIHFKSIINCYHVYSNQLNYSFFSTCLARMFAVWLNCVLTHLF